jgi:hypothetical protein
MSFGSAIPATVVAALRSVRMAVLPAPPVFETQVCSAGERW